MSIQGAALMQSYVRMLLAAQANRHPGQTGPVTDLDAKIQSLFADQTDPNGGSFNDVYLSQYASTCSSESAANSFDIRLYPHNPPPPPPPLLVALRGHHQRLVTSNPALDHLPAAHRSAAPSSSNR